MRERPLHRGVWTLGLGLLFLSGAAQAQAPKASRPQVSADGVFSVQLFELADGKCRVEVQRDRAVVWELGRCVGTADDLYFVSTSGDRFWVVKSLGEKPKGRASWLKTVVAKLYDREGKLLRQQRVGELVPSAHRSDVRQLRRHFKWLEGVAGVPGAGPRVNNENQLEFEVVGGKRYRLPF